MLRIINDSYNEPDRTAGLCRDCCLNRSCPDITINARREMAYFRYRMYKIQDSRERRLVNSAIENPCPYHYKNIEDLKVTLDKLNSFCGDGTIE